MTEYHFNSNGGSMDEPPTTQLSPEHFDALVERLDQPARYDPRIARVLLRQAPWDSTCDKTSTSADQ